MLSCMDMAYVCLWGPTPKKAENKVGARKILHFWYLKLLFCWVVFIRMLKWHATELRRIHKRTDLLLRCDRCCPRYAQVLNRGCWYFVVPSGDSLWRTPTWSDHSKYQVQRLFQRHKKHLQYTCTNVNGKKVRYKKGQKLITLLLQRMNLRTVKVKSIWNSQSSLYFFQGQPFKRRPNFQSKEGAPFGFQSNNRGNAVDSALQRCPDWFSIVRVRLLDGASKFGDIFSKGKTSLLEMDFPHEWVQQFSWNSLSM